ncbi:MAG: hypothetical protein HKP48_05385 [Winogradskyella sp.]|uniref:hypothetical protein n=1 Tax=Winogradskyella sp. TaxID=1883156 RepID=UPI0017C8F5EA|nr:hypothetical protein [Winogradskyella sp.]MBT8244336.1 hypothetical protein [Winogradskyella sp.]NNK22731.1 hypothetical protein [Winogradskyella sp.]
MKFLFSLATLFFLTGSCNSQKETTTNSNKSNTQSIKEQQMVTDKQKAIGQNYDVAVIYEARSRGSAKYIYVSKVKIMLSQDLSLQKMDEYPCNAKDWEEVKKLLDDIERKAFQNLKAPTDKRLYDGAAHTTLSIKQGDVIYMTPSFDAGFPPKEIEELVNKVLALAEKVKKQ